MVPLRTAAVSWVLLLSVAALLVSCAPERKRDAETIDSLRTEAEQLIKAQALMGWNSWVFGTPSNQDSLYNSHANLFTKEHINLVQKAEGDEPDSVQKKRLRYFRRYLTTEYIAKQTAPLSDRLTNLEATTKVSFEGKDLPYRQVSSLLINEPKQKRRAGLYAAVDPVLDTLNTLLREIEQRNQRLAIDLGFASYTSLAEEVKGFSLTGLTPVLQRVLGETASTYTDLLREAAQKYLHLSLSSFFRYDIGALFRSREFDAFFSGAPMLERAESTYAGLGINLQSMKNLTIDADSRPLKIPRAVCYAIDVPSDVRLSVKPVGGFDDYRSLFHELGHALHYSHTKEYAFEFKYLGEPTVTENYAFLSEYLLVNQAWLRLRTSMPVRVQKDFLRLQALYRLYFLRRYCAKVLYELQLHDGVANPSSVYAQLLSSSTGYVAIPSDEKHYLVDVDQLFYSASYLRAWLLEGQFHARLNRDYGVNWFERPEAGAYLESLWGYGDRYGGDEFVRRIGYESISPDALLAELKTMVLFSTQ